MNLDGLLPNLGEWLRGTGPESDVVVSTRIRLARNIANFPFATRASAPHKAEIEARAREAVVSAEIPGITAWFARQRAPSTCRVSRSSRRTRVAHEQLKWAMMPPSSWKVA